MSSGHGPIGSDSSHIRLLSVLGIGHLRQSRESPTRINYVNGISARPVALFKLNICSNVRSPSPLSCFLLIMIHPVRIPL